MPYFVAPPSSSSALASRFKNSYAVTIVVPHMLTLVILGRTPRKKPT
jgi:hypothetical protein